MNPFLSDYIFSLPSRSQEKIQDILAAAQVSKENLDDIAKRLNDIQERSPLLIRPETYGSIISVVGLDAAHRDVSLTMREMFDESNSISLLLDTQTEILSSEFKRYQDQLVAFEKYINSYSFMLSDQSFYDHGYSESFSDDIQKETDPVLSGMLYDRSTIAFDKNLESLEVDHGSGILTLGAGFVTNYPLFPRVLRSNCIKYVTSDSGIEKSVSETVGEGWRVAISSPRPISSSIIEDQDKGAQFELEYSLESPIPCDTISIKPMSDSTIDVLSIKVYGENLSTFKELVTTPKALNKDMVVYFEQDMVSKIVVIVNQPIYTRGKLPPVQSEITYKDVLESQRQRSKTSVQSSNNSRKAFHRLFNKWFLASEKKRASLQRPVVNLDRYSSDGMGAKDELSYQKEAARVRSLFKYRNDSRNIFSRWIAEKLFKDQPELLERYTLIERPYAKRLEDIPFILKDEKIDNNIDPMNYEYVLGIRNVNIGITVNKDRGLFISKPVPSPVQSGEVRIQTNDTNYMYEDSYLDNPQVTTIEYSVTNKSNPSKEEDWVSILPAQVKGSQIQERLFLQSSGYGAFRFRASSQTGISIFKNGYSLGLDSSSFVRSNDNLAIVGVRIPQSEFSLNADDIYIVEYLPEGDPTTVNFEKQGFRQKNLASAYDSNGAGELFQRTGNSRSINLAYHPYVDTNKISEETTYSSELGLVGSYQPIKVVLSDGTIAYNYTNYVGLQQNDMSADDPQLAFLHSGKEIIFNKEINQEFRVYYQYEPSYLRYRVIFRINDKIKVSPFVDSLVVKMKMNASILGMNDKKV
jgi:hypothetical protein